jgi:hypothetical protein
VARKGPANGGVGVLDWRAELAGGEGVQGAETGVEFGGGQVALAIERAEKIGGATFAFQRIAFQAAGNQVAVGVAAGLDAGHDMVEALVARVGALEAVKTVAAFTEVDRLAQGAGLEEVEFFEVDRRERVGKRVEVGGKGRAGGVVHGDGAGTSSGDFIGQAHFEDVAGFAALDEAKRAEDGEAAHRFAHGAGADAEAASDPGHGAVELEPAFEAGVAEEIEIDGAVGDGQAQARVEKVRELLPEKREIQFFAFHVEILRWNWEQN